jgi:starch synthase
MAASEIVPFAKTGGLADVVGALSSAMAAAGVKVNLVMPAYRPILQNVIGRRKPCLELEIGIAGKKITGSLIRKKLSANLDIYFVRADEYFDRYCFYGDSAGDYPDNAERFAFFSRSVLEVARLTKSQVIHLHDWQAAPAAAFLRLQPERYPELAGAKTLVTIHNLAYQGLFNLDHWPALDLDPCYFNSCQFEFWDRINYLKSGLINADRLNTVSPTYACEIRQDGCGFGLEGVLQERAGDLSGILNGVDYAVWNPETDIHISRRYSAADLSGKAECKRYLQECYGLDCKPDVPLLCMVTRLAEGKGIELVMEIVDDLISSGVQFVMLGRGDRKYEEYYCAQATRYPGQAGVKIAFDEALAHQTVAGADILLMPSRHEPCGLTQMYTLKYGNVPVVRRTGGLADSVEPYDPAAASGDGFLFDDYSGADLLVAVKRALAVYDDTAEWQKLARRGMAADHSWNRSMQDYLRLYRDLIPA